MSGPDHYLEALRLINRAGGAAPESASQYLAEAQVHAAARAEFMALTHGAT